MVEYRAVGDDDRVRLETIHRHAFEPDRGPLEDSSTVAEEQVDPGQQSEATPERATDWPPDLSDPRGVFDGDDLVSVSMRYTLEATIRGEWTEIGGLGGVATPPEHRRQGHARFLLRNALSEYREDDVAFVTLWPASVPFYRDAGWATANRYAECEVPPGALSVVDGDESGRIRQLSADDWERLRPVEERRAERVGLSIRRSEQWWRERTLGSTVDQPAPYVYGYERDGELRGYLLYTLTGVESGTPKAPNGTRRLDVRDLAALDDEAERALLSFLADHDSQAATVRLRGRIAEECFDRGVDPDVLECSLESGPMVRATDVALALERHEWPATVDATLELAIEDPLLEHNDGRFRVDVDGGAAAVLPADSDGQFDATGSGADVAGRDADVAGSGTDAAGRDADVAGRDGDAADRDATAARRDGDVAADGRSGLLQDESELDASVDVGTLSQLCVGSIGVERAERFGGLDVRTEDARDLLETAFEPDRVCLREFF